MSDVDVYYFGTWGAPGHYLWTPDGRTPWDVQRALPWRYLDGPLAGDPALEDPRQPGRWDGEHQPEGRACLHHRDGWTALAFWDRSCDSRAGSSSAIIARGEHSAEEMFALFERSFPAVWRRISAAFEVVLPASSTKPRSADAR